MKVKDVIKRFGGRTELCDVLASTAGFRPGKSTVAVWVTRERIPSHVLIHLMRADRGFDPVDFGWEPGHERVRATR